MLIGGILLRLFNDERVAVLALARAGQRAENDFFGKPCGLMDQLACAAGGLLSIDFLDPERPAVNRIDVDFNAHDYRLTVVNTGGSHADLTPEYAAIPSEMRLASSLLGRDTARGLTMTALLASLPRLRREAGDRAILRLVHFIDENERVLSQALALAGGRIDDFMSLVRASGDSSWRFLQNCGGVGPPDHQPIPLALMLTERLLQGKGACRVHGGGFAGTIQAFIPRRRFDRYRKCIEEIFGPGAVIPLRIRKPGVVALGPDGMERPIVEKPQI
jgi:galactokinase